MLVMPARSFWLCTAALLVATSCVHPMVKFRKQHLLDPSMDVAKTEGFQSSFKAEPQGWVEKGSADSGGAVGGSCPTCGG